MEIRQPLGSNDAYKITVSIVFTALFALITVGRYSSHRIKTGLQPRTPVPGIWVGRILNADWNLVHAITKWFTLCRCDGFLTLLGMLTLMSNRACFPCEWLLTYVTCTQLFCLVQMQIHVQITFNSLANMCKHTTSGGPLLTERLNAHCKYMALQH